MTTDNRYNSTQNTIKSDNVPESITFICQPSFHFHNVKYSPQSGLNANINVSEPSHPASTPDENTSTQVSVKEDVMSTTQFVDDRQIVTKDSSLDMHIDDTIDKLFDIQLVESTLLDYLAKPIVLAYGPLSTTDTYSIFNSYSMPYAALTSTPGLVWRQKLAGFFGMRMDMKFKLVVNANKFMQGRYIMGWTPTGGLAPNTSNLKGISWVYAHNATLTQRTTVPHVEIDLSLNTSAEMVVPFASVNSYYPLNAVLGSSDYGGLGYLAIYPYAPLITVSGPTSCFFTLYVSFENVKLYGAASAQSGLNSKNKGVTDTEISNKAQGPISGVASAISNAANLFTFLPGIGQYASTVSWVADRVSKTASIFGFSKPTAGDNVPKMQILSAPGHTHVDGDSDARALSYLAKPGTTSLMGLSGKSVDEMDFNYIKMRYAYITQFPWGDVLTPGTVLWNAAVSPITGQVPVTAGGNTYFNYPPGIFLARQFSLWRGSLRFKFKFVKTEYHSGRLSFGFFPTDEQVFVSGDAYINRVIVDVREKNEVELVIPYLSRLPWQDFSAGTGFLRVVVIDPLVAPATVSTSFTILVEMSCGEDFEVAVPAICDANPSYFVPQSGLSKQDDATIISTIIGSSTVRSDDVLFSSTSIGDKISSLRTYLKRYSPIVSYINETPLSLNNKQIGLVPDMIIAFGSTLPTTNAYVSDPLSIWSACFMFTSGGMRIRDVIDAGMTNATPKNMHTMCMASAAPGVPSLVTPIVASVPSGSFRTQHMVLHEYINNTVLSLEMPQYTKTHAKNNAELILFQTPTPSTSTRYISGYSSGMHYLYLSAPDALTVTAQTGYSFHNIYRAAADDFNLSLFISVPPMIFTTPVHYDGFY